MSAARRVGGLLTVVLVAGFIAWGVAGGWSKAADYPWRINWAELVVALLVLAAFNLAWGLGYARLLETLGGHPAQRLRFMSIWARSVLGRYVPGNIVMFAGRVVLGREAGVSAQSSLTASVYEQLGMLVPAALGATIFLIASNRSGWSPLFWLVAVVPFGLVLLDPAVLGRTASRLLARLGRKATLVPLSRRNVVAVVAWFGVTMGLLGVGVAVGVRAVAGARVGSVAHLGLGFLLAWVVSMVAFVFPSGIGVREGAFAVVLSRHLPTSSAVSLAAASRLILTAVELVVVAILVAAGRSFVRRGECGRSEPPSES